MHSSALAVAEKLAGAARALFHPGSVAINLEAVIPHFHKIVLIDVALIVVCTNTHAGGDGAVVEHGAHIHSGVAAEKVVSHLALQTAPFGNGHPI